MLAKRLLDVLISAFAIIILSPIFLAIAALIALNLGRPVLFRQSRPGLHGKPFMLMKFRSMTDEKGPDGILLPDEERLTKFGKFLRNSSLDELPELFNVLKGEMSLVGPRPLLTEYLSLYSSEQARRHEIRPGITGWSQINGRNAISWEDKFAFDVWYVDHQSLWLDIKILCSTVAVVLSKKGINEPGHPTATKFTGNQSERHRDNA